MKITVKMTRGYNDVWRGKIAKREVTACPSDVLLLFAMGRGDKATFEISNFRPRNHEDYHVFEFLTTNYRVTEVTAGAMPCIVRRTSQIIRDVFLAKKQTTSPIYVAVL